ncbi:hypothetical protein [uncultured Acidovorax sp.]|uniref:hypothetical protein n=1 Tax=uncultured Acidovorax sp. TaxID=158751 RepID=UPI00258B12CC|nr:hypothetical protein [uncultured Acidovorax sp.]
MDYRQRLKPALRAALIHLLGSILVGLTSALLFLSIWYPTPFNAIAGGFTLWGLIVAVDIACGPLLTLVVFNPRKPRLELARDIGFILLLQLCAFAYGIYIASQARPIYLAYEGNRYRLITYKDINKEKLAEAPADLRSLSLTGPRLLGVKLSNPTDPDFQQSVLLSLQGLHPAYRPSRWTGYETLLPQLQEALLPLEKLKIKHPDSLNEIELTLTRAGLDAISAGYLPLEAGRAKSRDWVVIVERSTGIPKAFLPLDGW